MEIKVSTENGRVPVTVLHVDGNIDSATYQTFQSKVNELIKGGTHYILVDLSHAPYVSSAGFRALHQIFNELRALSSLFQSERRGGEKGNQRRDLQITSSEIAKPLQGDQNNL